MLQHADIDGEESENLKLESNPLHWTVDDVVRFIKTTDCANLAWLFRQHVSDERMPPFLLENRLLGRGRDWAWSSNLRLRCFFCLKWNPLDFNVNTFNLRFPISFCKNNVENHQENEIHFLHAFLFTKPFSIISSDRFVIHVPGISF